MFGLTTRRLRAEVAAVTADRERIRSERDEFEENCNAAQAAAKTAARQFADTDEKYVDTCIVNERLTSDLTAARERLAEYGGRRTVGEVLEEHDVHRKALADALGDQKRHLNWEQLIGEVGRLAESAIEQMAGHVKEKARADELQAQLDDAARELAAVRKVEESLARQIHEMAQPVEPSDEEVDAAQLRLELDAERHRADHLQKELDNACGMPPGGILNSAPWQPGYKAERDKQVSP